MNSTINLAGCSWTNEDRISNLPDAVLQHILSFLPTKHAVAAAILSQRWKHTWTSISTLDFSDELWILAYCPKTRSSFMDFINKVLLLHDTSNLCKFHLSCTHSDLPIINSWISTLVMRYKLQELDLHIHSKKLWVVPISLFACKSLVKMELGDMNVQIPISISMPNLKHLRLSCVRLCCDGLLKDTQFVFSFPNLEKLCLHRSNWVNTNSVKICAPKLKTLDIFEGCGSEGYDMKIDTESLVSFTLEVDELREYLLYNASSLVHASIAIHSYNKSASGQNERKLLRGISNVKDLSVTSSTIRTLCSTIYSTCLLTFVNLTNLEVNVNTHIRSEELMRLLHMLPHLESLGFPNGAHLISKDDLAFATVPHYFPTHLKTIEFQNIRGSEDEVWFAGSFLKNASVLERMTIISLKKFSENQANVKGRLVMLPRGSTCCTLDFSLSG